MYNRFKSWRPFVPRGKRKNLILYNYDLYKPRYPNRLFRLVFMKEGEVRIYRGMSDPARRESLYRALRRHGYRDGLFFTARSISEDWVYVECIKEINLRWGMKYRGILSCSSKRIQRYFLHSHASFFCGGFPGEVPFLNIRLKVSRLFRTPTVYWDAREIRVEYWTLWKSRKEYLRNAPLLWIYVHYLSSLVDFTSSNFGKFPAYQLTRLADNLTFILSHARLASDSKTDETHGPANSAIRTYVHHARHEPWRFADPSIIYSDQTPEPGNTGRGENS